MTHSKRQHIIKTVSLCLLYCSSIVSAADCQQILEEQQRLRLENQALHARMRETIMQVQHLQQQLKQLTLLQKQWLDYWQQLEPAVIQ